MPDIMLRNNLLTLLTFLKHKAEDKGLKPIITVAKLIDMMPGAKPTYDQLQELIDQDPTIGNFVKSKNRNQIELRLESEEASTPEPESTDAGEDFSGVQPFEPPSEEPSDETEVGPEEAVVPEEPAEEAPEEPQQPLTPRKPSVVSQMAKRAARRNN